MNNTKSKIFLCGGVMLLLIFIHMVYIMDNTTNKVTNTPVAIAAFNG